MNAGFLEVLKLDDSFDCFIFADVDLVPLHLCNFYECSKQPRHLGAYMDTFDYEWDQETQNFNVVCLKQLDFFKNPPVSDQSFPSPLLI